MKPSTAIAFLLACTLVSARKQDVYAPHITSPTAKTDWRVGKMYNVTWDTKDAPKNITNSEGKIKLRKDGKTMPLTLADHFDIRDGSVNVTAPWVDDGKYAIVLFGDSGNFSPEFMILN